MTLVESWGRSVQHDDSHDRVSRRLTRRAALQLGAGAGVAAVAAPYVARHSAARARVDLARRAAHVRGRCSNWPVPPIVTRAQWGANEASAQAGSDLRLAASSKIIVHHTGTPNDITDYAGLCRGILANETSGEYIDIAYNWLIDPNGRIYEGRWAQNYPAGVAAHRRAQRRERARRARDLPQLEHHRHRVDGHVRHHRSAARDDRRARHAAHVEVRALGHRPARSRRVSSRRTARSRTSSTSAAIATRPRPTVPGSASSRCCRRSARRSRVASPAPATGSRPSSGRCSSFGGAPPRDHVGLPAHEPDRRHRRPPVGAGYWLFAADGSVYAFGDGRVLRDDARPTPRRADRRHGADADRVTATGWSAATAASSASATPGSSARPAAMRLNAPVLGMTPDPHRATATGSTRATAASSASATREFFGSTGSIRLNQPVVSMAARPQGDGYWMIARDGGIFSFGRAPFEGSAASATIAVAVRRDAAVDDGQGLRHVARGRPGRDVRRRARPRRRGGQVFGRAIGIAGKLKPFRVTRSRSPTRVGATGPAGLAPGGRASASISSSPRLLP